MIYHLRQETFHHSNKSGKYLANQIRWNREKPAITVIKNSAGKLTSSPEETKFFIISTINYILQK